MTDNKPPLSQILYGPPGTGKTYHTVNRALQAIGESTKGKSRKELRKRFNELKKDGRIEMVTFHQNYAYEDFIEGIKPGLDGSSVAYKLEDGILKKIAARASGTGADDLIEQYADHVDKALKEVPDGVSLKEGTGDKNTLIIGVERDNNGKFSGFKLGGYVLGHGIGAAPTLTRQNLVALLKRGEEASSSDDMRGSDFHPMVQGYYSALLEKIRKYAGENSLAIEKPEGNYVLIIDEINRGNIAKIFGELITLIEDSKRAGRDEALELTLPYSKEPFSIPDNLYIIGTMNTADRSIALLDTALRRRFTFEEMMPNPKILGNIKDGKSDSISLSKLLKAINKRIVRLHSREHQIGHAYLMGVSDIAGLKDAFQHKIIPLLSEYFFEDRGNIAAVLNHNGFIEKDDSDPDNPIWEILSYDSEEWETPARYKNIIYKEQRGASEDDANN